MSTEEYLTVKELSERIKFSRQSLYNLIHRGTFVLGKHYLKPTPKKVLFKWSGIQAWMGDALDQENGQDPEPDYAVERIRRSDHRTSGISENRINI